MMNNLEISEEEMNKIAAATNNESIDDGAKRHHFALMGTAAFAGALPFWAAISSHWAFWTK